MSTPTPTFSGEVQLRRWSESSTQGVQVTFALADSDDLEPLKAKSGKRFMAVLVEIGDDEQPVDPKSSHSLAGCPVLEPMAKLGPLAKWVVMRCNEHEFWRWLDIEVNVGRPVESSDEAARVVKTHLEILSRRDLDIDSMAASRFHQKIRIPYSRWLARRGVTA